MVCNKLKWGQNDRKFYLKHISKASFPSRRSGGLGVILKIMFEMHALDVRSIEQWKKVFVIKASATWFKTFLFELCLFVLFGMDDQTFIPMHMINTCQTYIKYIDNHCKKLE